MKLNKGYIYKICEEVARFPGKKFVGNQTSYKVDYGPRALFLERES